MEGRTLTGRGGRLCVAIAVLAAMVTAAAPAHAGSGKAESPDRVTPQPRILGGGAADPSLWPFAAAVLAKGRFICSGSVVSPRHIVTAGHCGEPKVGELQVVTGRPNLRDTSVGEVHQVIAKYVHPDYRKKGKHDLSVFALDTPTSAPSVPIAGETEGAALAAPGSNLLVAGWGATTPFQGKLPGFLKTTTVRAVSPKRCFKPYGKAFAGKSMVCAAGPKLKPGKRSLRTSPCAGDSGGPLVAGGKLLGVVSFGPRLCGLPFAPVAYAKTFDAGALSFLGSAIFTPLP